MEEPRSERSNLGAGSQFSGFGSIGWIQEDA